MIFQNTLKLKIVIYFLEWKARGALINRILKMKYLYDTNELNNILYSENEIFNCLILFKYKIIKIKNILY